MEDVCLGLLVDIVCELCVTDRGYQLLSELKFYEIVNSDRKLVESERGGVILFVVIEINVGWRRWWSRWSLL